MSTTGSGAGRSGEKLGDAVKKTAGLVHGAGEALRGNALTAIDSAAGSHEGVPKNQAIAEKGMQEMETGRVHSSNHPDTNQYRSQRVSDVQPTDYTGAPGASQYQTHPTETRHVQPSHSATN
ncbi:hypothetical protein M501DRAFT_91589 [Patellaria atrata CBS 101060]|uniref:Uncharacterized protein n=1 Tax=Patellaria atrata CBS 101060 TaxID=1346257 RepID=A0A9P4VTS5_9PEZI|nr:hypothetical protein M501DRAFT_91589 [Patellaria atrata CBS 101060]